MSGTRFTRGPGIYQLSEGTPFGEDEFKSVATKARTSIADLTGEWADLEDYFKDATSFEAEVFNPELAIQHLSLVRDIYESKKESDAFALDLFSCILLHVKKGNVTQNNFKRLSDETKAEVNRLLKAFRLQLKPTNKRLSMTLPRLASAVPVLVCQIAATSGKQFTAEWGTAPRMPLPMCCSTFPALIPQDGSAASKALSVCYLFYCCDQSRVISGKKDFLTDSKRADILDQNKRILESKLATSTIPKAGQIGHLKSLGAKGWFNNIKSILDDNDYEVENLSSANWDSYFA